MSTWAINFAPEAASLSEGLRAAAACAAVAAVAVLGHRPFLSWAAVAAFWACLIDPGGSTRIRAKLLLAFALAGTAVAILGSGVASLGLAPAVVVLFALTLVGAFLRVYGAEVSTLANILMIDAVYTASRPIATWGGLLTFGLLFLAGCAWATTLSLTFWRIHPFSAPRQALGAAFRSLAALAVNLAKVTPSPAGDGAWTAHAQHDRRVAREAIEAARASIVRTTGERGGMGATGARLAAALNVAEGAFARMIALDDTLERRPIADAEQRRRTIRLLKQLAAIFHRIDRYVEDADSGDPRALQQAIAHVARTAKVAPAMVCNLVKACAREAEQVLEAPRDPAVFHAEAPARSTGAGAAQRPSRLAPLLAEFNPQSLILRHAVRMAVSVSFAYVLTRLLRIPYGYWMTMTVVIIQQPYVATTWTRALERVLGSVLGGGLAALLGMVFHSQAALLLLIFPLAMATMAFRPVNYTLFVFFLTPLFVLILDLTHPEEREIALAGVRALNTVVGGGIALVGVMLIWPASGSNRLRLDLAAAIEANGRFVALAVASPSGRVDPRLGPAGDGSSILPRPDEPDEVEAARRRAGLASNVAEASQQRAALESWWRRNELAGATEVLGGLRRLAGTATTLWLQSSDPDALRVGQRVSSSEPAATGRWAGAATAALAAAVKQAAPIPVLPAAPSRPEPVEDNVLARELEDLYRAAAAMGATAAAATAERSP